MKNSLYIAVLSALTLPLLSQNDMDAMRYSQTFFGGTNRSKAMAGSFGALGADGSCMAINPAGIGLYKKGDINLGFSLRILNTDATHNGTSFNTTKTSISFDGLTLVGAWDSKKDNKSHHALGLSANQLVNFNNNIYIEGSSNHKSITQDMLATTKGITSTADFDPTYAGLGYNTYALDLDTTTGNLYSFVNTKYNTKQANSIQKSGRINEWNINYAYGYDDKLYIGAALGISSVNFNYTSTYSESDDKDSMRIGTYNYTVYNYVGMGGFKSLAYNETFKTTGTGYNFKIGAIYRASDFMRLGASFVTPTFYSLTDTYTYSMTTTFDKGKSNTDQNPPSPGGRYQYRITTPLKFTGSVAFLYKKLGALNIDYDILSYKQASLQGDAPDVFAGVNKTIKNKYSQSSNLRIGAELVFNPIYVRLGYAMYGSAFGNTFSGNGVTSFYTGGIGYRKNKFYIDLSVTQSAKNDTYYMYNSAYVDQSTLKNSGTTIGITVGSKF